MGAGVGYSISFSREHIIGIVGGDGKCNVMKFLTKYAEDK